MEAIVAKTKTDVIGKGGKIPWHIPEDMRHFKEKTLGYAVLMGRTTWEEIYTKLKAPLPGRRNIVLTSRPLLGGVDAQAVRSLDEAEALVKSVNERLMIIGGANLYRAAMPKVQVLHLTEVLDDYEGDSYFPQLRESEWERKLERTIPTARFLTLTRKP